MLAVVSKSRPVDLSAAFSVSSLKSFRRLSLTAKWLCVSSVGMLIASCGQAESPHLAMCQDVTKNLVGQVEWSDSKVSESGDLLTVNASYTLVSGENGKVSCGYRRERTEDGNGKFATGPESVRINGERVSTGDLISAGTQASKEQLTKIAKETSEQTQKVAREASEKAAEIAEQAGAKASELAEQAGDKASELAGQAESAAIDLQKQAKDLAEQAKEKLQQSLEN